MVTVHHLANTAADIKQRQSFQSSELMKTSLIVDFLFFVHSSVMHRGRLGLQDTVRKVMF